jgi:hypothetical protein
MWMYPMPSCTDHPFSEWLGDAKINTRIRRVLAHGADQNPEASPTPLIEGVNITRVSLFAFTFGGLCYVICSWHSRLLLGSCVCSRCAMGSHLTSGCDDAGSKSCSE